MNQNVTSGFNATHVKWNQLFVVSIWWAILYSLNNHQQAFACVGAQRCRWNDTHIPEKTMKNSSAHPGFFIPGSTFSCDPVMDYTRIDPAQFTKHICLLWLHTLATRTCTCYSEYAGCIHWRCVRKFVYRNMNKMWTSKQITLAWHLCVCVCTALPFLPSLNICTVYTYNLFKILSRSIVINIYKILINTAHTICFKRTS